MICLFKKTFLKDLAELPNTHRKKIEKLVFEDIPNMKDIPDNLNIRKMQGYDSYYRIKIGNLRVGCELLKGNKIVFYRVKQRKDIYRVFP